MATERWTIDPIHSTLDFVVAHLVIARVRGSFTRYGGSLELDSDPRRSSVSATIEAASLDTRFPQRDAHLRSPDFFDVEKHPEITFASRTITGGGDAYEVTGPLTLRGVTRDVTLHVTSLGQARDPRGTPRMAFRARGSINRKDFGMTWLQVLDTGSLAVGETVDVEIEIQALRAA